MWNNDRSRDGGKGKILRSLEGSDDSLVNTVSLMERETAKREDLHTLTDVLFGLQGTVKLMNEANNW